MSSLGIGRSWFGTGEAGTTGTVAGGVEEDGRCVTELLSADEGLGLEAGVERKYLTTGVE